MKIKVTTSTTTTTTTSKVYWNYWITLTGLLLLLLLSAARVRADVSLIVQGALGVSGEATGAGHASIYLSNVCAETPVRLRPCRPGEMGIVLAPYPDLGTTGGYEWIAIPVLHFLHGVDDPKLVPLYVNGEIRTLLRDSYRQKYLKQLVPDVPDRLMPQGRWQEIVGALYNREIYLFTFRTTPEQDARVIDLINERSAKMQFNILYDNCADFARRIINWYFPGATHRDPLNDFTMTTPKAVARSMAIDAKSHPEYQFRVARYLQYPGPIRRSQQVRNFSEQAFKSVKYLLPQIVFEPILVPIFATAYYAFGRFDPWSEYVRAATTLNVPLSFGDEPDFVDHGDAARNPLPATVADTTARVRIFGDKSTWQAWQKEFFAIRQRAIHDGLFADQHEIDTFFKDLELQSEPAIDQNGHIILKVRDHGVLRQLGLTRGSIIDQRSDPGLAARLLIAMIDRQLKSKPRNRQTIPSFEEDWTLMLRLIERESATRIPTASRKTDRFLEIPEKVSFKRRIQRIFILLTH